MHFQVLEIDALCARPRRLPTGAYWILRDKGLHNTLFFFPSALFFVSSSFLITDKIFAVPKVYVFRCIRLAEVPVQIFNIKVSLHTLHRKFRWNLHWNL
jgi:hypothetical protein